MSPGGISSVKIKANLFLSSCCWSMFDHSNEDGALGRSGAGIGLHFQAFRVPSRGLSPFTQYTLVYHTLGSGGGAPQCAVNSGPALLLATNDIPKSGSQLQVGIEHRAPGFDSPAQLCR